MSLARLIAFATLTIMGLLAVLGWARPSMATSSERKANSVGWLSLALLALLLVGCKTAPSPDAGPLPSATVAAAALCEPPPDLYIPTAANSQQLEEALYSAYMALRAQYLQCLTYTHKDARP